MKTDKAVLVLAVGLALCMAFLSTGCSSLTRAATSGDISEAQTFLDKGEDINQTDDFGWTPLMWAVYYDQPEMVKFLIGKGANVNVQSTNWYWNIPTKSTALIIASFYGKAPLISLLLENGAQKDVANSQGYTALMYAKEYQFEPCVKLLK